MPRSFAIGMEKVAKADLLQKYRDQKDRDEIKSLRRSSTPLGLAALTAGGAASGMALPAALQVLGSTPNVDDRIAKLYFAEGIFGGKPSPANMDVARRVYEAAMKTPSEEVVDILRGLHADSPRHKKRVQGEIFSTNPSVSVEVRSGVMRRMPMSQALKQYPQKARPIFAQMQKDLLKFGPGMDAGIPDAETVRNVIEQGRKGYIKRVGKPNATKIMMQMYGERIKALGRKKGLLIPFALVGGGGALYAGLKRRDRYRELTGQKRAPRKKLMRRRR